VPIVLKSGSLIRLESSGPFQDCCGIVLFCLVRILTAYLINWTSVKYFEISLCFLAIFKMHFLLNTKRIRDYFAYAPSNDVISPKNEGEG